MADESVNISVTATGTDQINAQLTGIGDAGDAAVSRLNAAFNEATMEAVRAGKSMAESINASLNSIDPNPVVVPVSAPGAAEVQAALQSLGLTAEEAAARMESGFVRSSQSAEVEASSLKLLESANRSNASATDANAAAIDRLTGAEILAAAQTRNLGEAMSASAEASVAAARSFGSFSGALGGALTAVLGFTGFEHFSDGATKASNAIKQITGNDLDAFNATLARLNQTAQATQVPLDGLAQSYMKISQATAEWGNSADKTITILDTFSKAMYLNGTSGAAATRVMNDYIEMLNRGEPTARLFNQLNQQAPSLMRAVEKELGTTAEGLELMRAAAVGASKEMGPQLQLSLQKAEDQLRRSKSAYEDQIKDNAALAKSYDQVTASAAKTLSGSKLVLPSNVAGQDYKTRVTKASDKADDDARAVTESEEKLAIAKKKVADAEQAESKGRAFLMKFNDALYASNARITAQAGEMSGTIGGAITNIVSSIELWLIKMEQATGYNEILVGALNGVANNLNVILPLVIGLGVAFATVKIANFVSNIASGESALAKLGVAISSSPLAKWALVIFVVAEAVNGLVGYLGGWGVVMRAVTGFVNDHKTALEALGIVLGAVAIAFTAIRIGAFVTAIGSGAAAMGAFAIASAPVILTIAGIAAGVLVVLAALVGWQRSWEIAKTVATGVWTAITGKPAEAANEVKAGAAASVAAMQSGSDGMKAAAIDGAHGVQSAADTIGSPFWTGTFNNMPVAASAAGAKTTEVIKASLATAKETYEAHYADLKAQDEAAAAARLQQTKDAIAQQTALEKVQKDAQIAAATDNTTQQKGVWDKFWDGMKTAVQDSYSNADTYNKMAVTSTQEAADQESSAFTKAQETIKAGVQSTYTNIDGYNKQIVQSATSAAEATTSPWQTAWNAIVSAAQSAWDKIKSIFSTEIKPNIDTSTGGGGGTDTTAQSNNTQDTSGGLDGHRNGTSFQVFRDGGTVDLGAFKNGGEYRLPGAGRPDTKLVQFMASPGERVIVQTQAQQADHDKKMAQFRDGGVIQMPHYRDGGAMTVTANIPHFRNGGTIYDALEQFKANSTNSLSGYNGIDMTKVTTESDYVAPAATTTTAASTASTSTSTDDTKKDAVPAWVGRFLGNSNGLAPLDAQAYKEGLSPYPGSIQDSSNFADASVPGSMSGDSAKGGLWYTDGSSGTILDYYGAPVQDQNFTYHSSDVWIKDGVPQLEGDGSYGANNKLQFPTFTAVKGYGGVTMQDYVKTVNHGQLWNASAPSYKGGGNTSMKDKDFNDAIEGSYSGSNAFQGGLRNGGMFYARDGMDYDVPGAGGVDTRMMQLAVSPGENVSVKTRAQQAADAKGNSSGGGQTIVINQTVNATDADSFKRSKRQINDDMISKLRRSSNFANVLNK